MWSRGLSRRPLTLSNYVLYQPTPNGGAFLLFIWNTLLRLFPSVEPDVMKAVWRSPHVKLFAGRHQDFHFVRFLWLFCGFWVIFSFATHEFASSIRILHHGTQYCAPRPEIESRKSGFLDNFNRTFFLFASFDYIMWILICVWQSIRVYAALEWLSFYPQDGGGFVCPRTAKLKRLVSREVLNLFTATSTFTSNLCASLYYNNR